MGHGYAYIVLGAGKQGVAAAYDLLRYGQATHLTLADSSPTLGRRGVRRLKHLLATTLKKNRTALVYKPLDARRKAELTRILRGHDAVLSALPYYLNPRVAEAAIDAKIPYNDLGGYFETTRRIMKLNARAKKAGVTLITDCGVAPGLCNSLAACGIAQLTRPRNVRIYCGGLPQKPRPPLGYKVVFSLEGLLGNYFGKAFVLRKGKIMQVSSLSGREKIHFGKRLGILEAGTTGGATSTCPWTYKDILDNYDYKTLRYPGHYDKILLLKSLGLLDTAPIQVDAHSVSPRDVFVAAAGPRLQFLDDRDLLVMRVIVQGERQGEKLEIIYDVLDYYDPKTGFTAMQRTTGFSAALITALLAQGRMRQTGVVPVEKAIPGHVVLKEIRQRGIRITEKVRRWV